METIDLGIDNLDTVEIKLDTSQPSEVDLPGIELLMNDNVKKSNNNNVEIGDLNNLEDELNNLSQININIDETNKNETKKSENSFLGGIGEVFKINENDNKESNVGAATAESIGNTNTWDGFSKINEIPSTKSTFAPKMNDREMRRKKKVNVKKT